MKGRTNKLIALLTASSLCLAAPMSALATEPGTDTSVSVEAVQNEDEAAIESESSVEVAATEEETEDTETLEVSDQNNVMKAGEEKQDEKTRTAYLSDLQWKSESHTNDPLPTQKDKSFGELPIKLKVGGEVKEFKKGIGTQTDSTIVYDLEGKGYTKFEVYAGVDYSMKDFITAEKCDVKFQVKIDGTVAKETAVLNPESDAEHIVIDIPEGAKTLTLYADKVTEPWSDHADWADAKFTQILPEPQNVALNKTVVARRTADNTEAPVNPDPSVDSSKAVDGIINTNNYFDFGEQKVSGGLRESIYTQIDLKGSFLLSDIKMWRYWLDGRSYQATAIAVSEDENFTNPTVIYNSDTEGTIHNLGAGTDTTYVETADGKAIPVPFGTKARYIRVYSYGSSKGNTNHLVEVQVNAYVFGDEIAPEDPDKPSGKVFENAETPLKLQGPGTNDQVTHPDVTVLDEAWNGYKYWMAYTPNKPGTSYYENPCIAASNDGVNWEFPAVNPVQPRYDSEIQNENEHNCDTDMVYDPVNKRMIMYWEWAVDSPVGGETKRSEIRYRVSYDGINWGVDDGAGGVTTGPTAHGCAIRSDGERYSDLSPTVVYDEKEKIFKMWANDAADIGYNNKERNKVWYRTSENGLDGWSEKTYVTNFLGVNEEGKQMYPWHQDIQWIEELQEYWALQQAFPAGSGPDNSSLRFSKSKDGLNWEPVSERALITVGEKGAWDAGQIYRSTFRYEPAADGAIGQGTFHIWYAALAEGQSHWDIGYTKEKYSDVMYKLTGKKPSYVEKRITVDNENPLLIMPLYGKSYKDGVGVLDWGDTLVGRWEQVPEDLKKNAVIELHLGGKIGLNEGDARSAKAFYEQQLEIAEANNVPVMLVVATAGLQAQYTGLANLDSEWIDSMFKKYSVVKGIMSTENYWTDYNKVAERSGDYLRIAAENGGYFVWSEHQEAVIENVVANSTFNKALNEYGDSFIFTWKNTPAGANANAGSASYMQGLWLTGMCGQWGGLMDTWKWFEKRFGKLFDGNYSYISGGEEARPVATEPEALLGIEMMSIYTNGGCVYNFEHPAYVYGSYDKNSPCFENVVAEFMRYAIENPAPDKEEVLADTKVAFYGKLNILKNQGKMLQQDLNWKDATLPTQITGRYGLIPAVPEAVSKSKVDATFGKDITVLNQNSAQLADKTTRDSFFNEKYEEKYTGTAFGQMVSGTWYLYNSSVNVNTNQNAKLPLSGDKSVDITMTPHTYIILDEEEGGLDIRLNNYRVNKDSIWEGYGITENDRWDTDHNTMLQDWVRDEYIPNPDDGTFRDTTFELTGLDKMPVVEVKDGLKDQYSIPVVNYDEKTGTATVTVPANGWVNMQIALDPVETDKTALNAKIAEAKAINQGNYTDASFKALKDAIKEAEKVASSSISTQAQIDAQVTALDQAIKGLTEKPVVVDKSKLNAKITEAKAIAQGNYTDASFKALKDAITEAEKTVSNSNASQAQVDAQVTALEQAIKGLTEKPVVVDKSKLNAKITEAKAIAQGNYTDASYKALKDAIAEAEKTAANSNASQAQVDAQVTVLDQAIKGLAEKPVVVDKKNLNAKIATAKQIKQGYYTEASFKALQNAIAAAEKTAADQKSTQAQVDAQTAALTKAIAALSVDTARQAADRVKNTVVSAKAVNTGYKNIKLTWNRVKDADGYVVMVLSGKTYKTVATINKNSTVSYEYKKATLNKTSKFRVKAYKNYNGKLCYSKYKTVSKKAVPQTPDMKASVSKKKVTLTWKKISGVSGYTLYTKKNGSWIKLKDLKASSTKYVVKGTKKGKSYSYKVKAYKLNKGKKVYSSYSQIKTVKAK